MKSRRVSGASPSFRKACANHLLVRSRHTSLICRASTAARIRPLRVAVGQWAGPDAHWSCHDRILRLPSPSSLLPRRLARVMAPGCCAADRLGELNSYKRFRRSSSPTRRAWSSRVEEINAAGGVLGRPLEIVSRDDNGNPGDAVRVAEELLSREKVDAADGHVRVERRPRRRRPREAAQGAVPRRRAAHRQDRLGERQPLHVPPARLDVHADGDARARGGEARQEALGDRLSELRVRPIGDARVQEADDRAASRAASSSSSRRCRSARSTPAPWCRRSLDAKPDAIFSSLFGRRSRAVRPRRRDARAVQGSARCSTCWAASRSISIR